MADHPNKKKIPVWLIVVGFMFGFWPGGILLAIRLKQDASERDNGKARSDVEWEYLRQEAARKSQRTYNAQGQRTYTPPTTGEYARREDESAEDYARRIAQAQKTVMGRANPDGTYRYVYQKTETNTTTTAGRKTAQKTARKEGSFREATLMDHPKLSAKAGKGLRLAGNIVLGCGTFFTALSFLAMMAEGNWFADTMLVTSIVALCCCTPGLVLSILGGNKHNRVMRCRTYAAMIGARRSVSIEELAAAIPTRYAKCVDDLQWMLGEGMLRGMYIDGASKTLTYPDVQKAECRQAPREPVRTGPGGEKIYPEEARIRALNEQIADHSVSNRMERLEELTHKILAYAEEHPEKESSLRQFRNHYLPKTFSILESYARMERMGVEGGNIGAAMKDVEAIMDKLVLGFEKQLDALFDSEAMDVTTDVSVLENMMTMEGLSDLDPFGSLKKDEELRKY